MSSGFSLGLKYAADDADWESSPEELSGAGTQPKGPKEDEAMLSESESEPSVKRERSPSLSPLTKASGVVAVPPFASYLRDLFGMMIGHPQSDVEHPEERVALAIMDEAPNVWVNRGWLYDLQYFGTFIRVRSVAPPSNVCHACHRECSRLYTFQVGTGCDSYSVWNEDHEVAFLRNQWPSAYNLPKLETFLPPVSLSEGDLVSLGHRCASEARAYHKLFHLKAKLVSSLVSRLQEHHITNVLEFDEWAKSEPGYQFCLSQAQKWDGIRDWFDQSTWKDKKFYTELQFSDD